MQELARVAALPLGPSAASALKKIPGYGIPVCVLKSSFAKPISISPPHSNVGSNDVTSELFSFDSSAVVYGRLVYNRYPSSIRSAKVVVSAHDERGYNLNGKRFSQTCPDSTKKGDHVVLVELMRLSLSNFLRLAARKAGLTSIAEDKILLSSRPRMVIMLCNSLESIHDFEQQNAIPLEPKEHFPASVATAPSCSSMNSADYHPNISSDAKWKKSVGQAPGEKSCAIQTASNHGEVEGDKVLLDL